MNQNESHKQQSNSFLNSVASPSLRLTGIIGPFYHWHKKLITKAYHDQGISILYSPLTCFEVSLKLYLGNIYIGTYYMSPVLLRESATEYQQLITFELQFLLPDAFFKLQEFLIEVELRHRISDFEPVTVALGKTRVTPGPPQIFPLKTENSQENEIPIICDLMRYYISLMPSSTRAPSPLGRKPTLPSSFDMLSYEGISDTTKTFIGDLEIYAGAVNTFAAMVSVIGKPSDSPLDSEVRFKKPSFFVNSAVPPSVLIPKLKQIIQVPLIAKISDDDFKLLKSYPSYSTKFPSGFLKFAEKTNEVFSVPHLPPSMALMCLTFEQAKENISNHAIDSLRGASIQDLTTVIDCFVQTSFVSGYATKILGEKCRENDNFAVTTYWALYLERQCSNLSALADKVYKEISTNIRADLLKDIQVGEKVITNIHDIVKNVKNVPSSDKVKYVQSSIKQIVIEQPFKLPLDPSFVVTSISEENIIVFGSSLQPVKIDFLNSEGDVYSVIFKVGDDMRQDALALNIIKFFDLHLKKYGQDLCMSPYTVIPITRTFGICQFIVGAKALSKVILQNKGSIENFFEHKEEARKVFIKSCAAYSVISYVLGVGDRHLDNLLVSKSGNFLHVDFGFMFGNDPKPVPVTVRVAEEMVLAMGKEGAKEFLRISSIAYIAVRKVADELCCMLALMSNAGLPHLPKTTEAIARTMMSKLFLYHSDEEAGRHIITVIENSIKAILPSLFEWLHRLAVDSKK